MSEFNMQPPLAVVGEPIPEWGIAFEGKLYPFMSREMAELGIALVPKGKLVQSAWVEVQDEPDPLADAEKLIRESMKESGTKFHECIHGKIQHPCMCAVDHDHDQLDGV